MAIQCSINLSGIDWNVLKRKVQEAIFYSKRGIEPLEILYKNKCAVNCAYDGDKVIEKARMISDRGCNASNVDVWILNPYPYPCYNQDGNINYGKDSQIRAPIYQQYGRFFLKQVVKEQGGRLGNCGNVLEKT